MHLSNPLDFEAVVLPFFHIQEILWLSLAHPPYDISYRYINYPVKVIDVILFIQ
jgi:hypothetical protein